VQCVVIDFIQFEVLYVIGINYPGKKMPLTIILSLALVACNGNSNAQNEDLTVESEDKAPAQDHIVVLKNMNTKEQVAFSQQDLAVRLNVDPDAISLSGATPVTWRSGALGCPEPGMSYTEALVPGIWIMMRVGNTAYRYHAVPGSQPFYCPDERAEPPVVGYGAD